ncbi:MULTISPECIES: lysophospholipid acyltransferase family protein [Methylibium]|jgi:1-acyl-sn-glycerol-3-phosphate acyltransferase|uniref:Acyltransferase, putative n=1 Tax=Methylibium petroleiphilum (strain ATCC BAA-1232 / LMG 22953 / PM1) TaxID=420662 RepID=A2SFF2_METPP|nr:MULTISPECIES: lysophospholipid acyltransferase family protein [Methylibium]ABM94291.1 acyltransferase, putative [Methylibium petroleiphilum PM1]EWS53888.1 2-acyl-glycerophospho-ethanolamine acyltransferase [Methylibium sp. T29]EWS59417.1 2-acyl-glycerophospho-ethanolamine acyltransferase [Methylibium sp. T29-B]
MKRLFALPLSLALLALLLLLGVMSTIWNLTALLLYPLLPRDRGLVVGRAGIAYGYRLYWLLASASGMIKLDANALDAFKDEPRLIVVANHPSLLDALMLVARLPRSACIMKAGLMRNPFLGAGARLARYIRNDSPRGMIRLAVQDLQHGGQLVLFPEGTRTTRHPVNPFRPGVTLIAKLAGAPIQTVFIDTESPYLGKGWPIWKLPPLPIRFSVRLGERFAPQEDTDALLAQLEAYFAAGVKPSGPTA